MIIEKKIMGTEQQCAYSFSCHTYTFKKEQCFFIHFRHVWHAGEMRGKEEVRKPKFATKAEKSDKICLERELCVGLVGTRVQD